MLRTMINFPWMELKSTRVRCSCGEVLQKNSKWLRSAPTIQLVNTRLPLPPVLADRLSWTMIEMKYYDSVEDYAHVCQLSKIYKFVLLGEPTYKMLQATSFMTQLVVGHEELLILNASSQGVEDSKACYTSFRGECL
ncbi:hypothetical protein RYX36_027494 [Vicia faba]